MRQLFNDLKEGLEEAVDIAKCRYCNCESDECEYFQDLYDSQWYQDVETGEWDPYDDGYVHMKIFGVEYCQYCGRKL